MLKRQYLVLEVPAAFLSLSFYIISNAAAQINAERQLTISIIMYIILPRRGGGLMLDIQPISDQFNHFAKMTRDLQSGEECQYENYVYSKLLEAEIQSVETTERLSHEEVMAAAQSRLGLDTLREK